MATCNSPPNPDTRYYKKVVKIGCIGVKDYYGDFHCDYKWDCMDCPIVGERYKDDDEFWNPGTIQLG